MLSVVLSSTSMKEFIEVHPLFYGPSDYHFFDVDIEFTLRIVVVNSYETFFD